MGEEGEEDEALWDAAWEGPPAATQGGGGSFHTQGGSFLSQQGGSFRAQGGGTAVQPGPGGGGPSASQKVSAAVPLVPPRTAPSMPPTTNGVPRTTAAAAAPLVAPRAAPSIPPTINGAAASAGCGATDGAGGAGSGGSAAGAGSAWGEATHWTPLLKPARRALLSDLHYGKFRAMAIRVGAGRGCGPAPVKGAYFPAWGSRQSKGDFL